MWESEGVHKTAQRRTKDGGRRDERSKRQTRKHRASQHDGFLFVFWSFGIQVVREAEAADGLETKRHETQSVLANRVGLPPFRLAPQGADGHASRVKAFEQDGGDEMTVQELRAQIAAIRPMLKAPKEWEALTEATQRDYQQKHAALNGRLPKDAAKCKRSYYGMRAAYLHMETRALRSALNALDKWTKQAMAENGNDMHGLEKGYMIEMQRLGIEKRITNYQAVVSAGAFQGPARGTQQDTHGKRAVGRLPKQWKTTLLGAVPKRSKYRAHVVAMALCGCRPAEFENGVLVKKVDQDTYEFTIAGKKTGTRQKNGKTFTTGQALRVLTISRTDFLDKHGQVRPEFIAMEKVMKGKNNLELMGMATAIRDAVIHASEKAFPDLDNRPTAYSFRHAFASELKAANGEDSADTAAALGHASTKTQQGYGYSKSSGGGLACRAKASDPIRTPHKTRKQAMGQKTKIKVAAMPSPNAPKAKMPSPMDKLKLPRAPAPRF